MPKDEEKCGNCRFFVHEEDGDGGTCHRYAPRCKIEGAMLESDAVGTVWPWLEDSDWCGEWEGA